MSDWTPKEFKRLLGYKKGLAAVMRMTSNATVADFGKINISALPKHVDWREKGIITAVKDQGQCGSCWTFGTAEGIESHWALKTGKLTDLSEQVILDCTANPDQCGGTGGCGGGTPELAYAQIIKQGGICSEWAYPYTSYYGTAGKCHWMPPFVPRPIVYLSGYQVLLSNDYASVLHAVAQVGPMVINVAASLWGDYSSGLYECNVTDTDIDHVVLLVGYGTDSKLGDYWLVRNSWSPSWGEQGYIRLKRRSTPQCGIDKNPQDGTGCKNGPPQVTVCGACGLLYDVSYPLIKS